MYAVRITTYTSMRLCLTWPFTPYVGHSLQHATKGMGGDENLGAIISHPSCCSELLSVDYSKHTPTTDLRSNIAALPLMLGPKTG